MRPMTLVTMFVLASWSAAAADQTGSSEPVLRVGVFGYQADGGMTLAAYDPQPSTNSTVYIRSLCEVGGGSLDAPARATDAWRFSGKVLNISAEEASLELDWQRIVDRGHAVTAPSGSVHLTLRAGEKVVLDQVVPDAPTQCSITGASFEARYDRSPTRGAAAGGGRAASGGSEKPRGGGVSSSGGGQAVRTPPWASSGKPAGHPFMNALVPAFDVNLWLVHNAPGRPEEVLHQAVRAPRLGAAFAFSPVTVGTTHGPIVVQVTGSFAIVNGVSGDEQLIFVTNRRVSTRSDLAVRDTPPDSQGGSRTTIRMPGPDDVLSFEMPPLRVRGQAAPQDKFSVRVRITPR